LNPNRTNLFLRVGLSERFFETERMIESVHETIRHSVHVVPRIFLCQVLPNLSGHILGPNLQRLSLVSRESSQHFHFIAASGQDFVGLARF
jgi:hypothetical protein